MSNLYEFDPTKHLPWFNFAAICLKCMNRWIATCPQGTVLFSLECPECHQMDSFASYIPEGFAR